MDILIGDVTTQPVWRCFHDEWLKPKSKKTLMNKISGGDSYRATPVPIPNTEVKPVHVDGTALETMWESRTLPG